MSKGVCRYNIKTNFRYSELKAPTLNFLIEKSSDKIILTNFS